MIHMRMWVWPQSKTAKTVPFSSNLAQGAGRPFDLPKKFPKPETCVFGFGTTWGTTFTKVILLRMAEAVLYFWKKTFQLLNKVLEGGQVEKSLLKTKCGQYQYLVRKWWEKNGKMKKKKVAPPGFEPGSLDPKSAALPTELSEQRRNLAKKIRYLYLICT